MENDRTQHIPTRAAPCATTKTAIIAWPFEDHPLRASLQEEAHARPPLPIGADEATVLSWALTPAGEGDAWPAPIDASQRHQVMRFGTHTLRFERHTEFAALTALCDGSPSEAMRAVIAACPGQLLSGTEIVFSPRADAAIMARLFGQAPIFGGAIRGGRISLATHFVAGADGLTRFLVTGAIETAEERGLIAKLIIDLETYRIASLLALPLVRSLSGELASLEDRAGAAIQNLRGDASLHATIEAFSGLLGELTAMQRRVRFRLSASAAYEEIVRMRLDSLGETPIGARQTLGDFITHRLAPALKTVGAFDRRMRDLSEALAAAMALARTRIDLTVQAQNQSLLASMERRARQQVHLAQAVEGFSIVALTYYGVGLLSYFLKALPDFGLHDEAIAAICAPVIAGAIAFFARRARRALDEI
ncbi:MAG: DUF3422 domain-containing protein [Alphaproteobacteria bacterium]|nr:DUF3422 domain-containing protein [Alphaproteobacteria bacterium]